MFRPAIDCTGRGDARAKTGQRGSALVGSMVVIVALVGILYAVVAVSAVEVKESRTTLDDVRVEYLAESGLERGMHFLSAAVANTNAADPLQSLKALFNGQTEVIPFLGEPLVTGNNEVGEFTVTLRVASQSSTSMVVEMDSTGYLPRAPGNLAAGEQLESWFSVRETVELNLAPSEVFDYAYFINNWGWFYGNTIRARGNVRSNGQFDVAGYSPTVTGQPLYDSVDWSSGSANLIGYRDDNKDGLEDGNDGGVWSGWDIVKAHNLQGNGGNAANQHEFVEKVDMPNLSNLTMYESMAKEQTAQVSIGGSVMSNAVYGDESGERDNLYLVGTAADPIVIDGPIVVRGDVIISGYVSGQGAIYAGGNVYVPESITYVNPPSTTRPAGNTEAQTEAWMTANQNADMLGLFARENVVVGDHTNSTWRYYVGWWMGSSMNKSEEDAGADGIPNTIAGRDGILGTADDDVLEDDGVFTVENYTQDDYDLGLIPPGYAVGDVVPGTGEDIDGDGQYDPTTSLSDVDFDTSLNTTYWGGNMPSGGISKYRDIASLYANNLDAIFYTNHSFCYVVLGSKTASINGALVSRNEDIVYGTPTIDINYDCRLLGGNAGMASSFLPHVIEPPTVIRYEVLDRDPNYYLGMP